MKNLKQFITQLLVFVIVFSFILSDYSFAKKQKPGAHVIVTKTDGYIVEGELLMVKKNSLLIASYPGIRGVEINVSDINKIKIKYNKLKTQKGLILGVLLGGITGYYIGNIANNLGDSMYGYQYFWGSVIGGGVIGMISGAGTNISMKSGSQEEISLLLKKLNKYARVKN